MVGELRTACRRTYIIHEHFARHLCAQKSFLPALQAATAAAELTPVTQPQPQLGTPAGGSNWQKKGGGAALAGPSAAGPWAEALGGAALLSAAGGSSGVDSMDLELGVAEEWAAAARGGPRQELVLVASLLTKAPNLAGLTRTCEVFRWGGGGGGAGERLVRRFCRGTSRGTGACLLAIAARAQTRISCACRALCRASSLVLGDLAVTRQKEFTSIAVTAHHWVSSACAQWMAKWRCSGGTTRNMGWLRGAFSFLSTRRCRCKRCRMQRWRPGCAARLPTAGRWWGSSRRLSQCPCRYCA